MAHLLKQIITKNKIIGAAAIIATSTYLYDEINQYNNDNNNNNHIRPAYCSGETKGNAMTKQTKPILSIPSIQSLYFEFHTPTELLENLATEMTSDKVRCKC